MTCQKTVIFKISATLPKIVLKKDAGVERPELIILICKLYRAHSDTIDLEILIPSYENYYSSLVETTKTGDAAHNRAVIP